MNLRVRIGAPAQGDTTGCCYSHLPSGSCGETLYQALRLQGDDHFAGFVPSRTVGLRARPGPRERVSLFSPIIHRVQTKRGKDMKRQAILIVVLVALTYGLAVAQRTDNDIVRDLQRRIGTVYVSVQGGVVTLTGTVPELSQKLNAENIARRTVGVRQVIDQVQVVPTSKVSDAQVAAAVRDAYRANLSDSEARAITVSVNNGVVTLTGTLPSSYPKQLATTLASFVQGVTDIRNQIVVKPSVTRTDAQILADVKARFAQNPLVPAARITVTVGTGVVTLTGTVTTLLQSDQAESSARFVPGVVDVRNNLFVSG